MHSPYSSFRKASLQSVHLVDFWSNLYLCFSVLHLWEKTENTSSPVRDSMEVVLLLHGLKVCA